MAANVANSKIIFAPTREHPYYNDFDESKNFHAFEFRPGYAVQARELTQLQSILQNQIERFGNHIFQNGSIVAGGELKISTVISLNLQPTYANTDIVASSFIGKIVQWSSNTQARAVVIDAKEATDIDPPTLAVRYLSGKEFGHSDTIKITGEETFANLALANSNTTGLACSVSDGIFFINGYFVKTPRQAILVEKYSTYANTQIGLQFTPEIIDEDDDTSLLDPAQESSNYQAPGATRLKITLALSTRPLESQDTDQFIELARFVDGTLTKLIKYPLYSEIGAELARRTYDESGSYTVRPFKLSFEDHPTDDTKFVAVLGTGKAYVKGYEYESIADTRITLDRARDVLNVQNYDLYCTYGNYFVGQNLTGVLDHTTFALADIHCLPYSYVLRANSTMYTQSKIGTARIRNLIYDSSANTADANTRRYKVSLTDLQFTKIQTNVNAATANTVTLYNRNNGTLLSANNNAYNGASLLIRTNGTLEKYIITNWTGSTSTATLNKDFLTTPNTSSNAVISFDFASTESLIIGPLTPGAPSETANINLTLLNKNFGDVAGDAYLNETNLDSLVFKFPQDYIQFGSMTDRDFTYRKKFSTTFTTNQATISVDPTSEAFSGNVSGIGSSTLLENYLIIGSDGRVVRLESVTVDGTQTATLTATDYSGTATVFATVNLNTGNNTKPKRKTLISGNTTHFVRHAANGTFLSGTSTNTSVYLVAGQASVQSPSRTQNEQMSLYVSDVKAIRAIYDLNGASIPAVGDSLTGFTNVTTAYDFYTGQKDSYYDHSKIALKPSAGIGYVGPLIVCFDYYEHGQGETTDGLGYFSVDSYPAANTTAGYADIPAYVRSDGVSLELRDCIDFRPRRQNASNSAPNYTMQGIRIPEMNEAFESDYSYHLPRRDYIVMTADLTAPFNVLRGYSAQYPQDPRNINEAMVLYKLYVPPYTESPADVHVLFIENKRYTMRDIGLLEKRIENIEYYQLLSLLEKDASELVILDEFGLERTKYGMIVDDFTGHGVGDVLNPDYKCGIDKVSGSMTPATRRKELPLFASSTTNVKLTTDIALLDYSEVDFIVQPFASKTENVQPYAFADFIGTLIMDPTGLVWIDTQTAPQVVLNESGVNDDFVAQTTTNTKLGTNVGSINDKRDAFEQSTAVEITNFGVNTQRTVSASKQTPKIPTIVTRIRNERN